MVNMENYEEYMLLYADRELTPAQENALLDFVAQHPELKQELDAYAATRLQPDETVVFADKEALIKSEPGGRTVWLGGWKTYAAAASVILFIVLFSINRNSIEEVQPVIVKNETITAPVTTPPPVINEEPHKTEELHSKPVNTIAAKTTQLPAKKQPIVPEKVEQKVEQRTAPVPPVMKAEEVIVKSTEKKPDELIAEVITPQEEKITVHEEPEVPTTRTISRKGNFRLAVLGDKPAGLDKLEEEVNEKLIAAKTIREQIKNTDAELSFRIGKKELFTVRF